MFWGLFWVIGGVTSLSAMALDHGNRAVAEDLAFFVACSDRDRLVARCFRDLGKHAFIAFYHWNNSRRGLLDVYSAGVGRDHTKSQRTGKTKKKLSFTQQKGLPGWQPFFIES